MRYCEEDDDLADDGVETETLSHTQRILDGIDLKDLADGKDVVFRINEDYDEVEDVGHLTDDEFEEVINSKELNNMRTLPIVKSSFKSISSSMVSLDQLGYVKKEIISEGTGTAPPNHSKVLLHYNFYKEYADEPFDSTYLRGKPCRLNLSQGEVIPGLELAIKSMKKGENSRFLIKWEVAFGKQGCPPRIDRECDILADVTLLDFTEVTVTETGECKTEEEIKMANFQNIITEVKKFHCSGNEDFGVGDIKSAVRSYRKCVKMLNKLGLSNEEEERKMLSLKLKCLVNLAVCYNKLCRYEQACIVCREALSIDPNSVKAIFQLGKAYLRLSNFEGAEKWLIKAQKIKPEDKDIAAELDKLHQKRKSSEVEDILFCQKALGNLNVDSSDSKVDA